VAPDGGSETPWPGHESRRGAPAGHGVLSPRPKVFASRTSRAPSAAASAGTAPRSRRGSAPPGPAGRAALSGVADERRTRDVAASRAGALLVPSEGLAGGK